ncbi:MAG: Hpt domain-containing protein [Bacteroidales bacterium]|nr:Hpt domain-containing protein [Bacteroidales bacterium]
MIDTKQFHENFKEFDKEVIAEIIDIYIDEYPERIKNIQKNIEEKDSEALRFNAHGLKGVVANFVNNDPYLLARELENKGRDKDFDGVEELFEKLKTANIELINDLKEIKKDYI